MIEVTVDARTGRRETPTATLVLSVDAPRSEWLDARRNGITATDLPAILGMSQYKTAIDVWNDKLMPPSDSDELGEAALWGMRLEEPVAQEWADRSGLKVRRVGLVSNVDAPWMMASLDRLVTGCPDGRCALEVKTRSLFVSDAWEKSVPDDVRTQVMWQLAVTGLDHIHVAALIGGQRLITHTIHPDADEIDRLRNAGAIVWHAVQAEVLPNLPPELWTTDYLDQRNPERRGTIEIDNEARATLNAYKEASAMEAMYAERKAEARTRLIGALGNAEVATIDGITAYTFNTSASTRIDRKALAAKYPAVADDPAIYSTTTSRTLRLATTKETK